MSDFIFYIHSEVFDLENFSNENIKNFVNRIDPILEIGRQLKADVYYSSNDIDGLNEVFTDFNDSYIKNQKNYLEELLKGFKKSNEKKHLFKIHFSEENTSLEFFDTPYFAKKATKCNIVFSLNHIENLRLLHVKSNNDFEEIELKLVNCKESVWKIINSVLGKRIYNFSLKHGNIDRPAIAANNEKASQLMCSDEKAQELLNDAIFDLNFRDKFHYNFDESVEKYVLFPFEGDNPQNKFHAFHLDNDEWHRRVPASIRKYFQK